MFRLVFTDEASQQLDALDKPDQQRRHKAVKKALGYLQTNPNHGSLNPHPFHGTLCPHGDTLIEVYAQNRTPGAYRIFYCYDPDERGLILVVAITAHP